MTFLYSHYYKFKIRKQRVNKLIKDSELLKLTYDK